MTIKTEEELKERCQQIADMTGCIVTVDKHGNVEQWRPRIKNLKWTELNNFYYFHDAYSDTRNKFLLSKSRIPITDPKNWLFLSSGHPNGAVIEE